MCNHAETFLYNAKFNAIRKTFIKTYDGIALIVLIAGKRGSANIGS